jgi:uncharacterized membrane protein
MPHLVSYVVALVLAGALDLVWLSTMGDRLYRPTLGDIMLKSPNLPAAAVFYLLYPVGLVLFAIAPALRSGSVVTALLYGAAFGAFTYGTYDLSNQATLRNWTTTLTLVDMAWGTFLAATSSAGAAWVVRRFVAR